FVKSKDTPFQRWYPYIEGYSTDFVKSLIENFDIKDTFIYEPFAGTGTTLFASDQVNLSTVYSEVNPLLQYLIQTKLTVLKTKEQQRKKLSNDLTDISKTILKNIDKFEEEKALRGAYKLIFANSKYFSEET